MNLMPALQAALTDVLYETRSEALRLIVGGGYGIYLKREHVRENGIRALLREWPEARSTNDLDLFLRPELLINSVRLKPLAVAIQRLGYEVISGRRERISGIPQTTCRIPVWLSPYSLLLPCWFIP